MAAGHKVTRSWWLGGHGAGDGAMGRKDVGTSLAQDGGTSTFLDTILSFAQKPTNISLQSVEQTLASVVCLDIFIGDVPSLSD